MSVATEPGTKHDHFLTLTEWFECLNLKHNHSNTKLKTEHEDT